VYHTLLFLHVLLAFTLVAAVTLFWALIFGTRPGRASLTPAAAMWLGRTGAIVVGIGSVGVLIFGIWLAIERSAYHPWDGWILASLILWVIAVGSGQRAGRSLQRAAMDPDEAAVLRRTGLQLQTVAGISLILILILMIWKPGA
jgi:uncharacterized membrane protein